MKASFVRKDGFVQLECELPCSAVTDSMGNTWVKSDDGWHTSGPLPIGASVTISLDGDQYAVLKIDGDLT